MTSTAAAAPPRERLTALARWAAAHRWLLAFGACGLAILLQRLAALDSTPLPQYTDEADIGYNAWAVATSGVDEHGHAWPLFFESFHDYSKSPVYVYALAPLTRILGLTPAVERLPAALSGVAVCALLALAAYRITRSRPVALLVLLTAGVEPWLVVQNRVGFDVNAIVLCVAGAIWAVSHAAENGRRGWFVAAGVWTGATIYGYETGRVFAAVLWVAIALSFALPRGRFRNWIYSALPVLGAYVVLLAWSLRHPGALTARFGTVSILGDHPGPLTVVARFVNNYIQYWGAPFLANHGDANLRHHTGSGGELLVVTLPAILLGIGVCATRWREPLPRFTLLGLLLGPVPAAFTMDGTPHALRSAVMLPFLLLASVYGWQLMLPWLTRRRMVASVLAVAALVEGVVFFNDMYHYWPQRSALAFEAGLGPAVVRAHQAAGSDHEVVLSDHFDGAYVYAYFWLRTDPHVAATQGLQALHMRVGDIGSAQPGDIMVLDAGQTPPPGSTLIERETVELDRPVDLARAPSHGTLVVASVWRR